MSSYPLSPFSSSAAPSAAVSDASASSMDLLSLLHIVEDRLRGIGSFWVKAEVSSVNEKGGHWYLEFIQKDETPFGGAAVSAVARGVIWRGHAGILERFARETGRRLAAGMTIVFHATVKFSARWGLSLDIDDIDTDFSLGLREKERRETLRYLQDSGLMDLQKKLVLPYLPDRIAVVSSASAAGYGDFMRHLEGNDRGFVFPVELFPAIMQGEAAPASIAEALGLAASSGAGLVLILRGGGADSDMFCYDDRSLCEAVCRCSVPVICAVGHEKDRHICDDVAFSSEKTPTAMAGMLISWVSGVEDAVVSVRDSIARLAADRVRDDEAAVTGLLSSVQRTLATKVSSMERPANVAFLGIQGALAARCRDFLSAASALSKGIASSLRLRALSEASSVRAIQMVVVKAVGGRLDRGMKEVDRVRANVAYVAGGVIRERDSEVEKLVMMIEAADPRKILKQGYVLAVDRSGNVLKGAAARKAGEEFILRHMDGRWDCRVEDVRMEKENN